MSKEFEVWTEGYAATGESSSAMLHGVFPGETFREAVIAFRDSLTDPHSIACVNVGGMSFWGCRFFDNEKDARASFG